MAVVAAQLVASVSVTGADQAKSNLSSVGTAASQTSDKLSSIKPFNAGDAVTDVDVAQAQLTLLESKVTAARDKLQTLQNSANAGEAVTGIPEVEANLTLLQAKAQQARENLQELQSGGEQASEGLEQVQASAETTNSSLADLLSSIRDTSTQMAGGFLSAIGNAGGGLLDFVNSAGQVFFSLQQIYQVATQVTSALLGPAVSAETMQAAFTNLLGSTQAATNELQQLNAFASKTSYTTMDIDQAASQMIGFGVSAKSVIPDLTAIGDALAAVGRGSSAQLNSVVNIFGKIQTDGQLTVGTMQELADNGINAWTIMEQQTGKTKDQLTSMLQSGLIPASTAISDLTKGIEANPIYSGGMAKQSQTMAGILSTLKSNFDQMLASFGSPIIQALESHVANLASDLASPGFKAFAGGLGQGIVNIFSAISSGVGHVLSDIQKLGALIGKAFNSQSAQAFFVSVSTLGSELGHLFDTIKNVAGIIASGLGISFDGTGDKAKNLASGGLKTLSNILDQVSGSIRDVSNWLSQMNFQSVIDGAKQVGDIFLKLSPDANIFEALSAHAQDLGKWFQTSVVPALKQAEPGFKSLGQAIAGLLPVAESISNTLHGSFMTTFNALLPVFEKAVPLLIQISGILAGSLGAALKFLAPYIAQATKAIGDFAGEIAQRVAPIITNWLDIIQTNLNNFLKIWNAVWPYLAPILKGTWDEIVGVVKIAWAILKGIIEIGLDLLGGKWKQAWTDFKTMLAGIWDGIKTYFSGVWEIIKGIFGPPLAWIKNTAANAWNWISSHTKQIWTTIKNDISDAWGNIQNTISSKATSLKNSILKPFNDAKSGIGNIVKGFTNSMIDQLNNGLTAVQNFLNFVGKGLNSLASDIGVKAIIPPVKINPIPHYATGTPDQGHPGGPAVVGEHGRELVFLPKGSTVVPNDTTEKLLKSMSSTTSVPGYANGIGDVAGNIMSWVSQGAQSIVDHIISSLHISAPNLGPMSNIASGLFNTVKNWAVSWVQGILPKASTGSGVTGQSVNVPGNVASWIQAAMALTGVPANWLSPLETIAMHESGGNPNAQNNWDVNAQNGDPSRGLFQTIGSTFAAYMMQGHGNILNPIDNSIAAIRYIQSRYQTVFNVPGIVSLANGGGYVGYANGTNFNPVSGTYVVGENGPELVRLPRGAQVVPNNRIGSSLGNNSDILSRLDRIATLLENGLTLDGQKLTRAQMPYIANAIRYGVGSHNF